MNIVVTSIDLEETIEGSVTFIAGDDHRIIENSSNFTNTVLGACSFYEVSVPGVSVTFADHLLNCPSKVQIQSDSPRIAMRFIINGKMCSDDDIEGKKNTIQQNKLSQNAYYLAQYNYEIYHETGHYNEITLYVEPRLFGHLVNNPTTCNHPFFQSIIKNKSACLFNHPVAIGKHTLEALHHLRSCCMKSILKRWYIETKAVELFLYQLNQFDCHTAEDCVKLSNRDKCILYEVKTFLDRDHLHPHTTGELSKMFGINRTKLNKGFKSLYGSTVTQYLTNLRMQHAKKLLEKGDLSISEISDLLHYSYPNHFSTAYKKWCGVPPGVSKSRI